MLPLLEKKNSFSKSVSIVEVEFFCCLYFDDTIGWVFWSLCDPSFTLADGAPTRPPPYLSINICHLHSIHCIAHMAPTRALVFHLVPWIHLFEIFFPKDFSIKASGQWQYISNGSIYWNEENQEENKNVKGRIYILWNHLFVQIFFYGMLSQNSNESSEGVFIVEVECDCCLFYDDTIGWVFWSLCDFSFYLADIAPCWIYGILPPKKIGNQKDPHPIFIPGGGGFRLGKILLDKFRH